MIQVSNVSKYYDEQIVLKDISFTVNKGELAYLTGPSGAGKTTLLKLIYRAERPDDGHIYVAGWDVGELRQRTIPYLRRNVGVVFQDFRLLRSKTVFENIALTLRIQGLHRAQIEEEVNEAINDVGLKGKSHTLSQHLSGGEQQRVVIARAMVSKPTVMLADEPTGNLDPETSEMVIKLFKEINARGTTVLIATHNKDLFIGTGRRVISLKHTVIEKETIA
jgi:cell division transport system ATP-binding protein